MKDIEDFNIIYFIICFCVNFFFIRIWFILGRKVFKSLFDCKCYIFILIFRNIYCFFIINDNVVYFWFFFIMEYRGKGRVG